MAKVVKLSVVERSEADGGEGGEGEARPATQSCRCMFREFGSGICADTEDGFVQESETCVAQDEQVRSILKESVKSMRSRDHSTFMWRRQKGEVFCVIGSLLLSLVLIYLLDGVRNRAFGAAWLVATLSCLILVLCLTLDYQGSQALCRTVSPLLFATPALMCIFPRFFCDSWGSSHCPSLTLQSPDLLLLVGFPSLLLSAPIMAWQAACALTLSIPTLFIVALLAQVYSSGVRSSDSAAVRACFTAALFTVGFIPLIFVRNEAARKLFAAFEASEASLSELLAQQKRIMQLLDDTKKENADKISKMRQFISYIFHEIRVPFNAVVLGIGHMLADNISEDQSEVLKMMDSSSSSMIRILNDVLDMGKIEAGKLHLEKQPFNMQDLIRSLVWSFHETFDSKGINFSLCIEEVADKLLSSREVLGDKHRVGQVLANYLSNAAKFTPRGGNVCLRVVCDSSNMEACCVPAEQLMDVESLHSEGESRLTNGHHSAPHQQDKLSEKTLEDMQIVKVTISVEDTGIGISREDQERLFEPYMQVHATSSQAGGGTGLGLCFSKRIVELAGGTIGVISEVDKGSTFSCTFPLELVPTSSSSDATSNSYVHDQAVKSTFDAYKVGIRPLQRCVSANSRCAASLEGRVPKVLIVEDNQVNRKIMRKLLSSFNVESDDAEDGEQALVLCRSGGIYDMILIDKEMPVMDGHEATRQLRAMGLTIPIIGLTGNALESDRNQFLAAGVDDFYTKPLSRHQLVKLLESYGLISKSKSNERLVLNGTLPTRSAASR